MFTLAALVLVSVLQFSAAMGGADAIRRKTSPSTACLEFSPSGLAGVVVAERTYYPANTTVQISNDFLGFGSSSLPAFCRLQLLVTTNATAGSFANTEVWLPDAAVWNKRMLTVGDGGLSGGGTNDCGLRVFDSRRSLGFLVDVMALGTRAIPHGFAGVSTNGGHNSSAFDGTWGGPHNDNTIIDFGWRAVHLSVLAGKDVVKQFYNQAPKRSYYLGCSTDNPTDVGAPANWMSRLVSWGAHLAQLVEPATSPHFIPEATWTGVIAPEVMRQCDALDGVTDNVINDPSVCHFRPETLACAPNQDPTTCLNAEQLTVLRQIYADYYEDGVLVFTGFNLGGEDVYFADLLGVAPNPLVTGWLQYMVLNDTTWTVDRYNSSVYKIADAVNPGNTDAIDPDLRAFAAAPHSGKVLHYFGLTDEIISPRNSLHYYDTVRAHALSTRGVDGGHGANSFGGPFQQTVPHDPAHDILAALIHWVEDGIAPTTITATKFNNDSAADGVAFTRPLCMHPLKVRFREGDQRDAASFECV
ncbi:hypothetical protein TRAPUB_10298 [Trametes pubescens]|uniref:Carboxylic ester hydrolase n=1 Tax=Trametes pubescens TaxID=154538 RepID=A0A1M2W022_TRAPU|nr:hypothetical protein TRAPUB_10298 [Trametes pubescens]